MAPQDEHMSVAATPTRGGSRLLIALLAVAVVVAAGVGSWFAVRQMSLAPIATPSTALAPAPAVPKAQPFDVREADEATILAARPATLQVFRYRTAPHILVLSFAGLHAQARMLDRLGAFVEKSGLPHDRVLNEADLQAAIRLSGDTEDTYYYGHDYRAADMARFFALADRDDIVLHPDEEALRRLLTQEGMLVPGATGAIISIPPETASPPIDAAARATILQHELSHGVYFTDPAYAAYARQFWQDTLTEAQRAAFRRFLGGEGYDMTNEDLMLNEAQAYLVHTQDPRYFRPELVGMSEAEAKRLRDRFRAGSPAPWLELTTLAHAP
jgi:hypothetical protein